MQDLIQIIDDMPTVSHRVISEQTGNQVKSIN